MEPELRLLFSPQQQSGPREAERADQPCSPGVRLGPRPWTIRQSTWIVHDPGPPAQKLGRTSHH